MNLGEIAADLRALGYDAQGVAGCVRIRLPLWCSVTFECGPDRVQFLPRFGFSSREGAVWADCFMFTLLVGLSVFVPVATALAASWLVVMLGDISRFVLTESAINTSRLLILTRGAAQPAAAAVRGRV
jgi:hypothetical protein